MGADSIIPKGKFVVLDDDGRGMDTYYDTVEEATQAANEDGNEFNGDFVYVVQVVAVGRLGTGPRWE